MIKTASLKTENVLGSGKEIIYRRGKERGLTLEGGNRERSVEGLCKRDGGGGGSGGSGRSR